MNFIDYCIATKNYSTLSAINDYMKVTTRTFASKKGGSSKGKTAAKIAGGVLGAGALGAVGYYGYPKLKEYFDSKDKPKVKDTYDQAKEDYTNMSASDQKKADTLVNQGVPPVVAVEQVKSGKTPVTDSEVNSGDGDELPVENWMMNDKAESRKFSNIYKRYGQYFR
jgi:hypothetical protein